MADLTSLPIKENLLPVESNTPMYQYLSTKASLNEDPATETKSFLPPPSTNTKLPDTVTSKQLYEGRRFPVYNPEKTEDFFSYGQGWGEKMVNGVSKGLILTGTTFLQNTVGALNGLGEWMSTGKFTSFYNNDFNKKIDDITKELDEYLLPNYRNNAEKDARWYSPDYWFTANFLWNDVIKNLGFSAGTFLSAGVYTAGLNAALKAIPIAAKLFSIGKIAETVATAEQGVQATANAAATYGKLKSLSDKFIGSYKMLNPAGRAVVAGLSTSGEAAFESYQNLNQFRNKLIDEYVTKNGVQPTGIDLANINAQADAVGDWSYKFNLALLSATQYIQLPKILGSSYKVEKATINGITRETRNIIEEGGKFIEKKPASIFQKTIERVKGIAPYTFSASEAFEEGSQFAIQIGTQHYYDKKYEDRDFTNSLIAGIEETLTTDEGMKNILIGGLSGAIMLGRGRYQQNKQKDINTKDAIRSDKWNKPGLNSAIFSDFTNDTMDAVSRGTAIQNERERLIKEGNISDSKDLEADYIINYLAPRIKYGRWDLVQSDIDTYKALAMSDDGFNQLVREGKALPTDTREAYLNRIMALERTAENVKSLYQSINIRYGGKVDEKGKPLYTSDVIDKMVYAASKVADYDVRIPQLTSKFIGANINIEQVLQDVFEGKNDSYDAALVELEKSNLINKDELVQDFKDAAKLTIRRKQFLKEYEDIKNSPEKHQENKATITTPQKGDEKPTVKVKTKTGERELEIGIEYYVGRIVEEDKDGNEVYRPNVITILKDNGDGTLRIKDKNGKERDIQASVLEDYRLGKVSAVAANPIANFFMRNWNNIVYWNTGKGKAGKIPGRLEHDPDTNTLYFTYATKSKKGKRYVTRIPIDLNSFQPKRGYTEGIFSFGRTLTAADTKDLKDQNDKLSTPEEAKIYEIHKAEGRRQIINDLFQELKDKFTKTTQLIEQRKTDLKIITEDLAKLERQIEKEEGVDKRAKKGSKFKSTVRKALEDAMRLSRAKEETEQEIEELEIQNRDTESILSYLEDAASNIEQLDSNTEKARKELEDDIESLKDNIQKTAKQISLLEKFKDELQTAIDKVTNFIADLIDDFFKVFPNIPRTTVAGLEWKIFHKQVKHPSITAPQAFNHLKQLEILAASIEEDAEVQLSKDTINEIDKDIETLKQTLNELGEVLIAKELILDRFQKAIDIYKAQKVDENRLKNDKKLIKEALGTAEKDGIPSRNFKEGYEAVRKKAVEYIWRSTMGVLRGKPHQIRANNFGFNLEKFENRKNIRGVYITSKNEELLGLKGLVDHLRTTDGLIDEDIDRDEIIAMVMVDTDGNLLGENGQPLTEEQLKDVINNSIYQVFPLSELKWSAEYNNESMFRKDTPDEVKDAVLEQYGEWRNRIIEESDTIDDLHEIGASFGIPKYDQAIDENGEPLWKDEAKTKPVLNYETRTSVEDAGLVTEDDFYGESLVLIPTINETESKGTTSYSDAIGRPFLELPNAILPLINRKHTEQEAETIFNAILQLAKNMMDPKIGITSDSSKQLSNWLRSVVYWGIPKDQEGNKKEDLGYNSVFWEKDEETGKFMLVMSGMGQKYLFTPTALEENKHEITTLLREMYNNVNSSIVKKTGEPYEEIISISPSGEIESRTWLNYQTYLLSNKFISSDERDKNNGTPRKDLPLATILLPTKDEEVNRTGIYFYTTDNAGEFEIPDVAPKMTVKVGGVKNAPKPAATVKEHTFTKNGKNIIYTIAPNGEITILAKGDIKAILEATKANIKKANPKLTDAQVDGAAKVAIKNIVKESITPKKTAKPKVEEEEDSESFTIGEDEDTEELVVEEEEEDDDSFTITDDDVKSALSEDEDENTLVLRVVRPEPISQTEDWTALENWLKANFPNLPVYRVKNVIQATNGRQAWGMFHKGALYIYENAEIGTGYHEVFEAIQKMFTSPEENVAIHNEFKSRKGSFTDRPSGETVNYSDATPIQIKEQLAEEFRDYVQYKKIPPKPDKGRPFILKFFADLYSFIKSLFINSPQSKIEEMFQNINKGAYRNIPYKNQLSFANQGVIDIEDAFGTEESEYSLIGISDKKRSDIIQHMTYLILHDIIKDDKSLFNVMNKKRSELYEGLKKRILKTIRLHAEITDEVVKSGIYTPAQRKVLKFMENVSGQWEEIVSRHEEYLKGYQIEFDENDQLQITNEDKIKESDYVDANKVDSFKKANAAIKLLLSTLVVVDNKQKPVPSSIGGFTLLPISESYIKVMNKLHNSRGVEYMLENLKELAEYDPNYRALYKRITKRDWFEKGIDLTNIDTQHGLRLLASFWKTFKKAKPGVKNVYILENGEVVVGDANLSTIAAQLSSDYLNSIIAKAKEGSAYFTLDKKRKIYVGNAAAIKSTMIDKPSQQVAFLKTLGIEFKLSDVVNLKGEQLKKFKNAVAGIRESIVKGKDIVSFSKKVLNIHGRLLELGEVQAAISTPEFDSTFFNINNEKTQTYIGTNPATDLYDFLSQIDKFDQNNVGGTQYSYLLTDVFAKGSSILKRMFTPKGERIINEESSQLMQVVYIGGTDNQQKGKQKESAKLNYKERLIQELNLNLKGYFLNLVPGDASMEWAIYMGNPVALDTFDKMISNMQLIFREYFISELDLVREERKNLAKGRNAKEMRFFKSILGEELHNKVVADTSEESFDTYTIFEKQINTALRKFITTKNTEFQSTLENYGILKEGEEGYSFQNVAIGEGLKENEVTNYLTFLNANFIIANIELHKLLYADPFQYADELKRIKNFNSPRQALINNSPKMNAAFDRIWNKGFKKDEIGWTNFTQDFFRSVTYKDVMAIVKGITGYSNPFKGTDGGGVISYPAYRNFRIRIGDWNDAEESQYIYDIAFEKQKKNKELTAEETASLEKGNPRIRSAYTPIKPIVSGNKANGNSYNDVLLDKFALYPISYRLLTDLNTNGGKTDSNALSLYNKMQNEKIDYAVFENSRKVGAISPQSVYNQDGTFNNAPYPENSIINVPFAIMSVQTEVPSKDDGDVTRGSQVTKLVTMDFLEAGVPIDFMPGEKNFDKRYNQWYTLQEEQKIEQSPLYKEIKYNEELLNAMTELGYQNLLTRLGIKEESGRYSITDLSNAGRTLRDEILKREVSDNISDALQSFIDGKSVLEATPAYHQIRNILYSIADKEVISPKINGGMRVLIPVDLLESVKAKNVGTKENPVYESDELKFYSKSEDGKTVNVCEIMIARWFDSPLSDVELLEYLNETEEGQKLLSGFAFRIPTQKQNSMEVFKVKQFLPREFGDSVILPTGMVNKTGGDFDIDKLTIYLKNVLSGIKPKLITLENDPKVRYRTWVINHANKDVKKYIKFLKKDVVKEIKNRFKSRFDELNNQYKSTVEQVKESEYTDLVASYKSIHNEILSMQDSEMKELFYLGAKLFRKLSDNTRAQFFQAADIMMQNNIQGPAEIQNYLELATLMITDYEMGEEEEILKGMIDLYEQELLILGSTFEDINSRKAIALEKFRENKNISIENVGAMTSQISSELFLEKQNALQEIDDQYIEELVSLSNLLSREEFEELPILQQNTKEALQNEYIQSLQNLATNINNYDRLVKPNSADQLKKLGEFIAQKTVGSTFDYTEVGNMIDRNFMSRLRHAFVTGKYAIGIAAVNQTNHSLNQRQPIYIDPARLKNVSPEDRKWLDDAIIKFDKFNKLTINGKQVATLSMIKNAEGQDISDIIAQFIDGYVDISKGPWIMELGATPNVASTFMFLAKVGVPIDTVAYFMNQPIIKDYLRSIETAGYSYLFMDSFVEDMKDIYDSGRATTVKQTIIPSKGVLKELVGKKVKDLNAEEREQQQFILDEFLKYAKMAEHMFHVTQGSNFDTANFNDPYLIFKKFEQLKKAQKTIISNVDDLLENSFVGVLGGTIQKVRNALATILKSDQQKVRRIIQQVLLPYVDMNEHDFVRLSQKAVSDLFDYAVQTNQELNSLVTDILVDDGGVGAEVQALINEIKNKPQHALYQNHIVGKNGILQYIPSRKADGIGVNNVKIKGLGNKVYDQNNIIYAFREIREHLKRHNNELLYDRIVQLAVLQSGLSYSSLSFTSVLPFEDFEKIYNKTLSKLNTLNLQPFVDLHVFQRNNWNNDNIVEHDKAQWITKGVEKPLYNLPMMFIKDKAHIQQAINAGTIPQLMTVRTLDRKADLDHIVYSWEKQNELLPENWRQKYPRMRDYEAVKVIKKEMRDRGDYSYINKGLFEKVKDASGKPLETGYTNKKGEWVAQYVYKPINAWGDGQRANEFYSTEHKSVLDNGFIKVNPVSNQTIINIFNNKKVVASPVAPKGLPATKRPDVKCKG